MNASEQFPQHIDSESFCGPQKQQPQSRTFARWCAYALVLVLPGSFEVLALLWLYRRCELLIASTKAVPTGR